MFSLGKVFSAPTVKVDQKERKVEYHPRTYSQFIRGLRDKELPSVIVRPNKNIALFQEENGDITLEKQLVNLLSSDKPDNVQLAAALDVKFQTA